MIITIDFNDKVIYIQECTIADTKRLPRIIEASGCDPKEFTIREYGEFTDSETNDIDIVYELNKEDIN